MKSVYIIDIILCSLHVDALGKGLNPLHPIDYSVPAVVLLNVVVKLLHSKLHLSN